MVDVPKDLGIMAYWKERLDHAWFHLYEELEDAKRARGVGKASARRCKSERARKS